MTIALIVLCGILLMREYMFIDERKKWQEERKDLYSRIQAGTLQEYIQTTKEPSAPIVKDREQRIAEQAEKDGLQRQDYQFPAHWK